MVDLAADMVEDMDIEEEVNMGEQVDMEEGVGMVEVDMAEEVMEVGHLQELDMEKEGLVVEAMEEGAIVGLHSSSGGSYGGGGGRGYGR